LRQQLGTVRGQKPVAIDVVPVSFRDKRPLDQRHRQAISNSPAIAAQRRSDGAKISQLHAEERIAIAAVACDRRPPRSTVRPPAGDDRAVACILVVNQMTGLIFGEILHQIDAPTSSAASSQPPFRQASGAVHDGEVCRNAARLGVKRLAASI
jgi:hypothetical protein